MSNSVRPHRWQPTRLLHPWDSPGKNTGMGCHFFLQWVKMKSESEVTQSYLTLRNPMDCSLPGSSVHGIFQARVLEWVATAFSERKLSMEELILLNCGVGEDSCESLGLQDPANQSSRKFRISNEYSLEGLMLKMKLQYFGHLM